MRSRLIKAARMGKRLFKNLLCATPMGRRFFFPPARRAVTLGPDDARYSWRLFTRQFDRLREAGFSAEAQHVLDVGPGRNIGSALLWWAANGGGSVSVVLWDVDANMMVNEQALRDSSRALIEAAETDQPPLPVMLEHLHEVAEGYRLPEIDYLVCDHEEFASRVQTSFDLILSHSCFEHIWDPVPTLSILAERTASEGWHFIQIDLMDHGSRETNYLEMLEWSDAVYWLTTRFADGVNRWRAQQYVDLYDSLGLNLVAEDRRQAEKLPIARERLARRFRELSDRELLTTELVLITHGHRPVDST